MKVPWPPKSSETTLVLEGAEEQWYRTCCERVFALSPGPERSAVLNEVSVILTMKHLLGAVLVDAPADSRQVSVSPEKRLATYSLMQEMEASGFHFPQSVKDEMADGQLSFRDAAPRLVDSLPDFDGVTYERALDHERLGAQLLRVGKLMGDGRWRTLAEITSATEDPEASVSARLRDLRKGKFGGHTVERERIDGGLYKYRVVLESHARPWDDAEPKEATA